jgi:hypothetical protein
MLSADPATDDIAALLHTAKEACSKAVQLCVPISVRVIQPGSAWATSLAGTKCSAKPRAMTSWRTCTLRDYSRRKLHSHPVSIVKRKCVFARAHHISGSHSWRAIAVG